MLEFSYTQRRLLAKLLPDFADRMNVDSRGSLNIAIAPEEVERMSEIVEDAFESASGSHFQTLRGIQRKLESLLPESSLGDAEYMRIALRIALSHSDPAVWRRIEVPDISLEELHHVIQSAMGWDNSHLYEFTQGHRRFVPSEWLDEIGGNNCASASECYLSDLISRRGQKLKYLYDFGDGWEHEIRVESIKRCSPEEEVLRCVDGGGACPPEDCGGLFGYNNLLAVIHDEEDPEREELLQWMGFDPETFVPADFDPAAFDVAEADQRLSNYRKQFFENVSSEDEEFELNPRIAEFVERFSASPEGREADKITTEEHPTIIELFLELADCYCGASVETIDVEDVQLLLFRIIPQKTLIEPGDAKLIVDELRLMFQFCQRENLSEYAADILSVLNDDTVTQMDAELSDPRNNSFGQSIVLMAQEAGVDLSNPEDAERFIQEYNAALTSSASEDSDEQLSGPEDRAVVELEGEKPN